MPLCKIKLLLFALAALPLNIFAVSYYVDALRGSDANSGKSPEKAWESLDKVNSTPLAPGDRVLFRAGNVWRGQLRVTCSGNAQKPLLFGAYGKGPRPRIDAAGGYQDALLVRNAQFVELRDFELTNHGDGQATRRGLHLVADNIGTLKRVTVSGLYIHDVNGTEKETDNGGIIFETHGDLVPSNFDGLQITRNIIWKVDRTGITSRSYHWKRTHWFPSVNVVISDNWVGDVGGDGIVPWATDGALIEHNIVQGANERAGCANAGIWPWSTDNSTFRLNEASGVKTTKDGEGFDSDYNSRNTCFEYNLSHDNDGGFMLVCSPGDRKREENVGNIGTIVRYNISKDDHARTFHVSAAENTLVCSNAIYVEKGADLQLVLLSNWSGWAQDLQFANNLFHVEGTAAYGHEIGGSDDGSYIIGPGWGPAKGVRFSGNRYDGEHRNKPEDDSRPCSPAPIGFDDWPGPQFDPSHPEQFDSYLKKHRTWMQKLMKRQFKHDVNCGRKPQD